MKQKQLLTLPIGLILLAVGIMIERFFPEKDGSDFIAGFLIGMSIVLNLTYIYKRSKRLLIS
jgi:hypothetical protein